MNLDPEAHQIFIPNDWAPRDYQQPAWDAVPDQYQYGVEVDHRRSGKDSLALNKIAHEMTQRIGVYWHMLPTTRQARKVIWENIDLYGRRMIDQAFPPELRKRTNNTDMVIEMLNGSIFQLCGSDNYDSLVGSNPVGCVYSEYSIAKPAAWDYLRPILRENGGWALFIYTPRGPNHGKKLYEMAVKNPKWWCRLLTVNDTNRLTEEDIQAERDSGMPEAMIRQEYYCDFNALSHGIILAEQMERARAEQRMSPEVTLDPRQNLHVIMDIGRTDATAAWFMQATEMGFTAVDYQEETGLDAELFIARVLKPLGYKIHTIYLPHDARAKTFQSRHSVMEQFIREQQAGLCKRIQIVPISSVQDKINAARWLAERTWFNSETCQDGIHALESWHFKYDEEKKVLLQRPEHDWASHPGDAFGYAGQVMQDFETPSSALVKQAINATRPAHNSMKLKDLWDTAPSQSRDDRLP